MNEINGVALFIIGAIIALVFIACAILIKRKLFKFIFAFLAIALICFAVVCFVTLSNDPLGEREYFPEISLPVEDGGEFVIKEWEYLSKCGVEFYYSKDGKMTKLGQTNGSNQEGFYPFNEGLYTVGFENGTVVVKWCYNRQNKNDHSLWERQSYELP